MAFKNIYVDEMIQLSGTWLDASGRAHAAILATPDLSSSLPRLKTAHMAITACEQPASSPRIAAIMEEEGKLDIRHDTIIRGIWGILTSQAELIGGDVGTAFLALRDTLVPHGLVSQLKTYRAEAGQAAQLSDRMTPTIRAQTDGILIGQGSSAKTLSVYIDEWIALGKQLGALEDEKGQLEADPSSGAELLKARNLWVRVVNVLVANAELADLDADTEALLFGPLRDTEKKADERVRQAIAKSKAAKAAAEKAAAEKAAAEKAAAEKAAAEKAAAEKAARQGMGATP